MSKMRYDDYRRLQLCLPPINNFVSILHQKYAEIIGSRNSFISLPLSDQNILDLTQKIEMCKQIEMHAIARTKDPIKELKIRLAPIEFSEEEQRLIKHCIKGARVYVGEFIDMINDGAFPISAAVAMPKTYLIAKNVLPPILDAMTGCFDLYPKLKLPLQIE